ncbi:hypothetical protein C8R48DRAFT_675151 [Suillus tomentosus]|nr:hypothetical protein C8R48DRAFT_675151 [Suillus tomentosus]
MVPAYIIAVYEPDSPLRNFWKGGIFNQDWVLLTVEELNAKYHEIDMHLFDFQYGSFKIAMAFFGLDKIIKLGRNLQTYTINPAMWSITTQKHLRKVAKDDEDEEVEIIEHVKDKFDIFDDMSSKLCLNL